jgi:hypothetical protein
MACAREIPNDCTLRSAITIANRDDIANTITFADDYFIVLREPLPPLTAEQTTIYVEPAQEVHLNGNGIPGSVLEIRGANITIDHLRIYGAGAGQANILVTGMAHSITIANNVIGDDDAPAGMCGQNNLASAGIVFRDTADIGENVRAWIYGNIIECHSGAPGDGIVLFTDKVLVGQDQNGQAGPKQRNKIRHNAGFAIRLDDFGPNTVRNNLIHDNVTGNFAVTNFNNNFIDNDVR